MSDFPSRTFFGEQLAGLSLLEFILLERRARILQMASGNVTLFGAIVFLNELDVIKAIQERLHRLKDTAFEAETVAQTAYKRLQTTVTLGKATQLDWQAMAFVATRRKTDVSAMLTAFNKDGLPTLYDDFLKEVDAAENLLGGTKAVMLTIMFGSAHPTGKITPEALQRFRIESARKELVEHQQLLAEQPKKLVPLIKQAPYRALAAVRPAFDARMGFLREFTNG